MGEPANFVFIRRPCREGVAVEAMNSHDTNLKNISVCVTRKGCFAHSISASGPGEYSSLIPNNCWLFEFAMTRFCTASAVRSLRMFKYGPSSVDVVSTRSS